MWYCIVSVVLKREVAEQARHSAFSFAYDVYTRHMALPLLSGTGLNRAWLKCMGLETIEAIQVTR